MDTSAPSSSFPSTLKKFCVVYFPKEKSSVAVVPAKWLIHRSGNSYTCKWPPSNDNQVFLMLSKEEVDPDEKWAVYKSKLIHSSNSYSKAQAALQKYQAYTGVDLFFPHTDAETSFTFTSKPDLTIHDHHSLVDINCSNCSNLEKRMVEMEQELQSVKKLLMDVKEASTSILESVQRIENYNSPQKFENFKQLQTIDELVNFDKSLSDSDVFSILVLYFSAFGAKDAHATTRKIMSLLISNKLARQFNWIGNGAKQSFQKFPQIIQLVVASVRHIKSFDDTSVQNIQSWIAKWLRYATDRELGGKKKPVRNEHERIETDRESGKRRKLVQNVHENMQSNKECGERQNLVQNMHENMEIVVKIE